MDELTAQCINRVCDNLLALANIVNELNNKIVNLENNIEQIRLEMPYKD